MSLDHHKMYEDGVLFVISGLAIDQELTLGNHYDGKFLYPGEVVRLDNDILLFASGVPKKDEAHVKRPFNFIEDYRALMRSSINEYKADDYEYGHRFPNLFGILPVTSSFFWLHLLYW